jgi:hypothetical protein
MTAQRDQGFAIYERKAAEENTESLAFGVNRPSLEPIVHWLCDMEHVMGHVCFMNLL